MQPLAVFFCVLAWIYGMFARNTLFLETESENVRSFSFAWRSTPWCIFTVHEAIHSLALVYCVISVRFHLVDYRHFDNVSCGANFQGKFVTLVFGMRCHSHKHCLVVPLSCTSVLLVPTLSLPRTVGQIQSRIWTVSNSPPCNVCSLIKCS